jgi:hypothetical protein
VDAKGVLIRAAKFPTRLDLSDVHVPFSLSFVECTFPGGVSLIDAELGALILDRCFTGSVLADRINVHGDVDIVGGVSLGEVSFASGLIKGRLNCDGWRFNSMGDQHALNCDAIWVKKNVRLAGAYHAKGETHFWMARVDGDVVCSGGIFENPKEFRACHLEVVDYAEAHRSGYLGGRIAAKKAGGREGMSLALSWGGLVSWEAQFLCG